MNEEKEVNTEELNVDLEPSASTGIVGAGGLVQEMVTASLTNEEKLAQYAQDEIVVVGLGAEDDFHEAVKLLDEAAKRGDKKAVLIVGEDSGQRQYIELPPEHIQRYLAQITRTRLQNKISTMHKALFKSGVGRKRGSAKASQTRLQVAKGADEKRKAKRKAAKASRKANR